MDLTDLRIFVATVEAGSFTAAAEKLLLSKQFVSRRITALETELGVRLLVRSTRKLTVADAGHELYERALRILAEMDEAEQAMSVRRSGISGTLRISAPMSFGTLHLAPVLRAFLKENPAVQLHVELSDRRVDLIGEGFDLAVRIGPLTDSSLIACRIGELPMAACASPAYLQRHGVPATPDELAQHDCLQYAYAAYANWEFLVDGVPKSYVVRGPLRANNGELIRDTAVAGLGIALLPEFILAPALQSGALVTILDAYRPAPLILNVVYPSHHQRSRKIQAFQSFMRDRLQYVAGRFDASLSANDAGGLCHRLPSTPAPEPYRSSPSVDASAPQRSVS
jgi:DNA-binding transcriptional LysR family regulator